MKTVGEVLGKRAPVVGQIGDTVRQAVRRMVDNHIGALPVLEGERVVGMFTERDVMRRVVDQGLSPDTTTVREVMTTENLVTATPEETYDCAVKRMKKARCRHVMVVKADRLVGVTGLRDLIELGFEEKADEVKMLEAYIYYVPPALTEGS